MTTDEPGTHAVALRPTYHLLRRRARRAAHRFRRDNPGAAAAVVKLQRGPWRWRVDYLKPIQ